MNRIPSTLKIAALSVIIASAGCLKDDFFGPSALKQIVYLSVEGQTGNARIVQDSLRIYLTASAETDPAAVTVDSVRLSTFATVMPGKGDVVDMTSPASFAVTAEDGSTVTYTVFLAVEGSEPQLENSGFDDWYTPSGKNYQEPGKNAGSPWNTANAGVTITGANNYNTRPFTVSGADLGAELVTRDLGPIAQITGQRMGAATLFTGVFELNIADPIASAKFGIPFAARPTGFSIEAAYAAGTPYKNGMNVELSKIDSADLYVLLENRDDPGAIRRIATGWIRLGSTPGTDLQPFSTNLTYGPLPSGAPDYQKPANNLYGTAQDKVTHISVVFSSSANGIVYEGGVNSTLRINNFKLVY